MNIGARRTRHDELVSMFRLSHLDHDQKKLSSLSERLEDTPAPDILEWAWKAFGDRIVMTSSFQTQSVPLLHIVSEVAPGIRVLFLDTGFHFPETLRFRDHLADLFGLSIEVIGGASAGTDGRLRGDPLYRRDPDRCCHIRKVAPLRRALENVDAWISGVRRDQTRDRSTLPILSRSSMGALKICPLATWTDSGVWEYLHRHGLPSHPLARSGYRSIGCEPCTRPAGDSDDPRSGRWANSGRTECGLHFEKPVLDEGETHGD